MPDKVRMRHSPSGALSKIRIAWILLLDKGFPPRAETSVVRAAGGGRIRPRSCRLLALQRRCSDQLADLSCQLRSVWGWIAVMRTTPMLLSPVRTKRAPHQTRASPTGRRLNLYAHPGVPPTHRDRSQPCLPSASAPPLCDP